MWQLHVRPTHARPAAARPQGRLQPPSSTWIRRGWVSPRQRPHLPRALQVQAPSQLLTAEEAWELLQELTRRDARGGLAQPLLDTPEKRARLRDAVLVAAAEPHVPSGWDPSRQPAEVLLGVLASDVRLAVRSLRDYCQALGLPFAAPESRVPGCPTLPCIAGAVYIKYNSASGLCYASRYEGRDRGVLLQLGQQQVGHLPLGLMDEAMAQPPPQL